MHWCERFYAHDTAPSVQPWLRLLYYESLQSLLPVCLYSFHQIAWHSPVYVNQCDRVKDPILYSGTGMCCIYHNTGAKPKSFILNGILLCQLQLANKIKSCRLNLGFTKQIMHSSLLSPKTVSVLGKRSLHTKTEKLSRHQCWLLPTKGRFHSWRGTNELRRSIR